MSHESREHREYERVVTEFPVGEWVYITTTRQIGVVEEVRESGDGPLVKVHLIGSIPVAELRRATPEEIRRWKAR